MKIDFECMNERNGISFLTNADRKIYTVGISTGGVAEIKMFRGDNWRHIIATTIEESGLSIQIESNLKM